MSVSNYTPKNNETQQIIDEGSGRKFFSIIPHLIDDSSLSVYAVRLYLHIKRRTGEDPNGRCFESTKNMAKICCMSTAQVSRSKRELEGAGFIQIETEVSKHGEYPRHTIRIIDKWAENMAKYSTVTGRNGETDKPLPPETGPLPQERDRYRGEIKEEPSKEEPSPSKNGQKKERVATTRPAAKTPLVEGDHLLSPQSLINTIEAEIKAQNMEPDREAVIAAIAYWQKEVEEAAKDGRTWKPTNLDAILERYDVLTLSDTAAYGSYGHRLPKARNREDNP